MCTLVHVILVLSKNKCNRKGYNLRLDFSPLKKIGEKRLSESYVS